MGLDSFTDDSDSSTDDSNTEDSDFPDIQDFTETVVFLATAKDVDIEVEDEQMKGDKREFGKLIALMLLDYPDSDPYDVVNTE